MALQCALVGVRMRLVRFRLVSHHQIDAQGAPPLPATLITTSHLPRGDDAIFFRNGAVWVTGDAAQRKLYLHMVDARLQYQVVTID